MVNLHLMEAKWFTSDSYHCDKCNVVMDATRLIEERIDPETRNPAGLIELKCGHIQKIIRVSNEINIAPLFRNTNKVTMEPQLTSGTPSASVSGGGLSIVGAVKLDLPNIETNNFVMNVSNVNIHGNNALVREGTNSSEYKLTLVPFKIQFRRTFPQTLFHYNN